MRRHGTLQSEKASQGYFPMALFGYSAGAADQHVSVYASAYSNTVCIYSAISSLFNLPPIIPSPRHPTP